MQTYSRREWLTVSLGASVGAALGAPSAFADTPDDLAGLTLKQASDRIKAKKVSPVELTEACFNRIKSYNPKINAWITVMREKAMAQAKVLEKEQAAGNFRSPLHGIPIGVKDSIDSAGVRTTAASAIYEYRFANEDAEVVRRLKASGAIILGKCNMHEFDAGATSAVSYWGPVRNPWNLEYVSGGSSGGSAAAVAMNNCFAALGTDTSGAIRTPAAYCGVVGFKPTYGRVSMRGIIPFSWSLDHCGPLTRTVEDAAMMMQQIAGYDAADIDCIDKPVPDYFSGIGAPVAQFRMGIAAQFFDHLDEEVSRIIDDALTVLNKLTKGAHEVSLPSLLRAGASAEVAAYHENLRGVNGGGYEPSTARVFPAAADNAKAVDYIKGWRELQLIRRIVDESIFQKQGVDLLVAPCSRRGIPKIEEVLTPAAAASGGGRGGGRGSGGGSAAAETVGQSAATPTIAPPGSTSVSPAVPVAATAATGRSRSDLDPEENTRIFNGYGLPVICLPCGFTKDGLPVGLQIAGPRFGEINVLALAYAFQEATEWHKRRPPLQADTKVPVLSKAAAEQTGG